MILLANPEPVFIQGGTRMSHLSGNGVNLPFATIDGTFQSRQMTTLSEMSPIRGRLYEHIGKYSVDHLGRWAAHLP